MVLHRSFFCENFLGFPGFCFILKPRQSAKRKCSTKMELHEREAIYNIFLVNALPLLILEKNLYSTRLRNLWSLLGNISAIWAAKMCGFLGVYFRKWYQKCQNYWVYNRNSCLKVELNTANIINYRSAFDWKFVVGLLHVSLL